MPEFIADVLATVIVFCITVAICLSLVVGAVACGINIQELLCATIGGLLLFRIFKNFKEM